MGKRGKAEPMTLLVCTRRAFLPCNYIGSFNAGIISAESSSPSPLRRARCTIIRWQHLRSALTDTRIVHSIHVCAWELGVANKYCGCLADNPGWSPARNVGSKRAHVWRKVYLSRQLQQQLLMRAIISSRNCAPFYLDYQKMNIRELYMTENQIRFGIS